MSFTPAKVLRLPDLLATWPWPRSINPLYEEVKMESDSWFRSFAFLDTRSQKAFDKCNFCLLASLFYDRLPREQLRIGCDLMNLFFAIDHYTDIRSEADVGSAVQILLDAMYHINKPRPSEELVLGEMMRQFSERIAIHSVPLARNRFLTHFAHYLSAVINQARDRDTDRHLAIDEYLTMRVHNIGALPTLAIAEMHLMIPDEIFSRPDLMELETLMARLIIYDNDLVSYNKEHATGDDHHNLLAILMRELGVSLDRAVEWIETQSRTDTARFLEVYESMVAHSDKDFQEYLHYVGNLPRGSACWGFESGRYFGSLSEKVYKERCIELWPKLGAVPEVLDVDMDIGIKMDEHEHEEE